MSKNLATLTAAAKLAGITLISYQTEAFLTGTGKDHMARVDYMQNGRTYSALEHFDRKSGQLESVDTNLDINGIYDADAGRMERLFWNGMDAEEYAHAVDTRNAIHEAMRVAIRESRRRPKKAAA